MRVLVLSKYAIVRCGLRHMLSATTDVEIVGEADLSIDIREIALKSHPDVVLIETVEAGDQDVARVVEKMGRHEKVNFVVLAGEGDPGAIRAMLRAGVTGYVLKQSTDAELLVALRSAACRRRFLDPSLIDAMTFEDASAPATEESGLTRRQAEVLNHLVQGLTSREIARKLGISIKTVETYRSRIYDKLEVRSRAGLMQYAIATRMISIHQRLKV